ncbi:(2Fe-2S)-binding protein [Sneathiella sp. CAU 1612]|uniref:(2Fe-2S)-binding protein n=1 Tax=Sneathiella sedimenti TaxID=2816034 RepID=A0ABS3F5I2_9PROT|nr:(2Fe-2S)-binding protein [Sneathiella sedimenti]MBO0333780.1 (2Fe-2S)-binding protein [Sneathiella sedimenti]
MLRLDINSELHEVDVEEDTPLLWVLRDTIGLKGTKFGCGVAACGACTVHVDGEAVRSCSYPVSGAVGTKITTIEGISGEMLNPVQLAWIQEQVPQCGYCQSGMIMAVSAFLAENSNPSDEDIADSITNICRCGTYPRIKRAIKRAAALQGGVQE